MDVKHRSQSAFIALTAVVLACQPTPTGRSGPAQGQVEASAATTAQLHAATAGAPPASPLNPRAANGPPAAGSVNEPPHAAEPPPSSASEPPYDRNADIERRSEEIRARFGKHAGVAVVDDAFVLGGSRGAVRQAAPLVRRVLAAYFNGRFSRRPARPVTVCLFTDSSSYNRFCRDRWASACDSPYGFYMFQERRIVMNLAPGIGTLTHELVHPIVETDFPQAPDWIDEGIASLFEAFYLYGNNQIGGVRNWRLPRLRRALGSKSERDQARLGRLFGMSDEEFRGPLEDLHYAMARYLCQWLDSQKKLWPFYQRWRDDYASDPTGRNAFTEVVGMSPEQADAPWRSWVRAL